MEAYRQLAEKHENMLWVEDHNITKYQIMADVMISDTSSTVYEFLLLDNQSSRTKPLPKIFTGWIFNIRKIFPTPSISYFKMQHSPQNANGSSTTTTPIWTGKSATVCLTPPETISPATEYPRNEN